MRILASLKVAWIWIDGNKTSIGAALFLVAAIIGGLNDEVLVKIWQVEIDWIPKIALTVEWLGGIFSAIGLGHKGIKGISGTPLRSG